MKTDRRPYLAFAFIAALALLGTGALSPLVATNPTAVDTAQAIGNDLVALRASIDPAYSYAFFMDAATGRFDVQTDAPIAAFAAIVAKYPGRLEFQTARLHWLADRVADTTPFWGGATIKGLDDDGVLAVCTSGYVARDSKTSYLVTAGHCFKLGAAIQTRRLSTPGLPIGTVTKRDFPAFDGELISGATYAPRIYSGANGDNSSSLPIYGQKRAKVGDPGYCRSGQTSGNSCGWIISSTDVTYCSGDTCVKHLTSYHGGTLTSDGDSGGPIYYPYNGGALIGGTITAVGCSLVIFCTNYGAPIGPILTRWSLTQVCSGACIIK
jgi:hypothetical protein